MLQRRLGLTTVHTVLLLLYRSYQGDLQYYAVYQAAVEVLSMTEPTVQGRQHRTK